MNNIIIEKSEKQGISIFYLKGALDFLQSVKVRSFLLKEIEDNQLKKVIINLIDVHYMDSSGLGALVGVITKVKKIGEIRLCNLQQSPSELLKLTRLSSLFNIDSSEEESINALLKSGEAISK